MTRILVVDDEPSIRASLRLMLQDTYEVLESPDGRDAVDQKQRTILGKLGDFPDRMEHCSRGLARLDQNASKIGVRFQLLLNLRDLDGFAPFDVEFNGVQAEGVRDRRRAG